MYMWLVICNVLVSKMLKHNIASSSAATTFTTHSTTTPATPATPISTKTTSSITVVAVSNTIVEFSWSPLFAMRSARMPALTTYLSTASPATNG